MQSNRCNPLIIPSVASEETKTKMYFPNRSSVGLNLGINWTFSDIFHLLLCRSSAGQGHLFSVLLGTVHLNTGWSFQGYFQQSLIWMVLAATRALPRGAGDFGGHSWYSGLLHGAGDQILGSAHSEKHSTT